MKKLLMIPLAIVALIVVVVVGNSGAQAGENSVEWMTVVDVLEKAPVQNKKIVLDVYTDWCGWCKRMDKDTYDHSEVAAYLKEKFLVGKMNPEKEGKVTYDGKEFTQGEFGRALGVTGYPATVFFNEKGEVLTMVSGYIKPAEFLKILKYFGDDHYLTMSYEDYSRNAK